jgi:2-polyprenyl-6-methoxyphenol hydroxylase-like FAD-dependent oxidoreductase
MAKIAIVGAGQAGMIAAHALLQQGHDVTVFSDKTPEEFLSRARPTGSATLYHGALENLRALGLEYWPDEAPQGTHTHLHFSVDKGSSVLLTMIGRLNHYNLAVDVRLQSATWMRSFDAAGGQLEIENVTVERLDQIAASNDLTLVAAGRAEIQELFPRDEARSEWTSPARNLALVCVKGIPMNPEYAPWTLPVKFNFFEQDGEMFWCPWLSKDHDQSWGLIFEAKPGTRFDRFQGIKSGEEALAEAKRVIAEFSTWDAEWVQDAELCDDYSWVVGSFTPQVRSAVGELPSGRVVMSLGDTAHSLDPVGGQGANTGNKMACHIAEAVGSSNGASFDADWINATADRFWDERARLVHRFNNRLLSPTQPAVMLLTAQYGSTGRIEDADTPQQKVADWYVNAFDEPQLFDHIIENEELARGIIQDAYGLPDSGPAVDKVLEEQHALMDAALERQAAGLPSGHPGS